MKYVVLKTKKTHLPPSVLTLKAAAALLWPTSDPQDDPSTFLRWSSDVWGSFSNIFFAETEGLKVRTVFVRSFASVRGYRFGDV